MKTFKLISMVVALAVLLAACGGPAAATEAPAATQAVTETAAEPIIIGVTIPTGQSPFCADFSDGVVAAGKEKGVTVLTNDPQVQIEKQISGIENFVSANASGIVVFPVDGNGVTDVTNSVMSAGVKVAAFDNTMPADIRVSEDEAENGRMIVQAGIDWVKANLGGKAEIAIITVNEPEDSRNGRILKGMLAAIEEQLPDSEVVSIQKSTEASETMTLVENIVQANPNVQYFITNLDGIMAQEALASLGYDRDDVFLAEASGQEAALKLIKDGTVLRSTIVTDTFTTGYNAALALIQLINGETPDPVMLQSTIVTIDNAAEFLP